MLYLCQSLLSHTFGFWLPLSIMLQPVGGVEPVGPHVPSKFSFTSVKVPGEVAPIACVNVSPLHVPCPVAMLTLNCTVLPQASPVGSCAVKCGAWLVPVAPTAMFA